MEPRLIKTEKDYEAALVRIDELMSAEPGTPEGDELELLAFLVSAYEDEHYAVDFPDPVAAIRFRMEQQGLRNADLVPFLGSKSKVSEVLSGRRPLSLPMIRKLHEGLGIPADVLLRAPDSRLPEQYEGIDWKRFPLAEMARRGWFPGLEGKARALLENAEETLGPFLFHGGLQAPAAAWLRQRTRPDARANEYALWAWLARVLQVARGQKVGAYEPDTVTEDFIREIARFSRLDDGPRLAQEALLKSGIHFVVEKHLAGTRLDGAAFCCLDGAPVVALTLRYDRMDHFWFTLCHELAHVARHLDLSSPRAFVDDLDQESKDAREKEADRMAADALIPPKEWRAIRKGPLSHRDVVQAARRLRVHPAVVAGRIRKETGNYNLLTSLLGQGTVRRSLGGQGDHAVA